MPDFKDLINEKNNRLQSVPDKLLTAVERQQKKVYDEILGLLDQLERDGDTIKITAKNLEIVSKISDDLKEVLLSDEYLKSVNSFVSEFDKQAVINNKYFKKLTGETIELPAATVYINNAKKATLEAFTGAGIDQSFIKPIQSLLDNAVASGSSWKETTKAIQDFVENNSNGDGKLYRYAKQITSDSFSITDRAYTNIISEALDFEWYYYSGGEIATTRCFCDERSDKFFHYKEIESWGDGKNLGDCNIGGGKWAGMIPGTNSSTIFNYCGGYNCQHSLMPVSIEVVDQADIDRAIELGFYKPE